MGSRRYGWVSIALVLSLAAEAPAEKRPYDQTEKREACQNFASLRQPFFGDTHVHTSYSFDAASQSTRNTPRDAWRFAKGEALGIQPYDANGKPLRTVKLDRPLDWTVVTDHAEFFGEVRICGGDGPGSDSDICWAYNTIPGMGLLLMGLRGSLAKDRWGFCGENDELCIGAAREAWQEVQAAANEAYDKSSTCSFTSFIGYEWTGSMGQGNNLHRNVVFRNDRVPGTATSSIDARSASRLWDSLEKECLNRSGCDVLTIPHNSNLSAGLMFSSGQIETLEDRNLPVTPRDAQRRARFEPLVEIMQHKGDSECLLGGSTTDEACGFEKLPYNSFAGVSGLTPLGDRSALDPVPSDYVRDALKRGIAEQRKLGVNRFKYGIIASTDTHLGTPGLTAEKRHVGHGGAGMSSATGVPVGLPDNIEFNPGGLAVVWAEENTRDSLFAAMQRKEVYGTSGTRPIVRFFGGWKFPKNLCAQDDFIEWGYATGVPMGGDLPSRIGSKGPAFAVSALRDSATGTMLQRIQIVKGWVANGKTHEKVFDVAGGDTGASVDLTTCEALGAGARSLCEVWEDPEFNESQPAFYYARVLENPTCRWSQYLCVEAGVDCMDRGTIQPGYEHCCNTDYPKTLQERAWTSPIWHTP